MGKGFSGNSVKNQIGHIGAVRVHGSLGEFKAQKAAVNGLYLAIQLVLIQRKDSIQVYHWSDLLHTFYLHEGIQIDAAVFRCCGQLVWGVLFGLYLLKGLAGREQKVKAHTQQNKSSDTTPGDSFERNLTDTCPNGFCGTV